MLLRADELRQAGYHDSSGVVVRLTETLRTHNAWSFEFMAYNMAIPPGARAYQYANRLPSEKIAQMLGTDQALGNGTLTLRQIHAHAHHHATAVSLHRLRDSQWTTLFELNPYCGYGACQHFQPIPNTADGSPPTVIPGDELEFRCTYDNPDHYTLGYGLSAMSEMCGPILIYTPHDSAKPPRRTWYESSDGVAKAQQGGAWSRSPAKHMTPQDFPTFTQDTRSTGTL